MKVVAIIAEYNPFHQGHAYQLRKVREVSGADFIVVVMSGDWVQRGEPAIVDKYVRTEMALRCGADLVLELPLAAATGSAGDFAQGAVAILEKLGCIDQVWFGGESDDLPLFEKISQILAEEPDSYRSALRENLAAGKNFPAAREAALMKAFCAEKQMGWHEADDQRKNQSMQPVSAEPDKSTGKQEPDDSCDIRKFLRGSNNILGLEYCLAIKKYEMQHADARKINPKVLLRSGDHYHEEEIHEGFASAQAIRRAILNQMTKSAVAPEEIEIRTFFSESDEVDSREFSEGSEKKEAKAFLVEREEAREISAGSELTQKNESAGNNKQSGREISLQWQAQIPPQAVAQLDSYIKERGILSLDDFSEMLAYQLLHEDKESLTAYKDISPDLANRIYALRGQFTFITGFADLVRTRNKTLTSVQRSLVHILLQLGDNKEERQKIADPSFVRVLGFARREDKMAIDRLLHEIKNNGSIRLITKASQLKELPARTEVQAAELYEIRRALKKGDGMVRELSRPICIYKSQS